MVARSPSMTTLLPIWNRILNCAKGAELQTETKSEMELEMSYWNTLPNDVLNRLLYKNLSTVGGYEMNAEESKFAETIQKTAGCARRRWTGGEQPGARDAVRRVRRRSGVHRCRRFELAISHRWIYGCDIRPGSESAHMARDGLRGDVGGPERDAGRGKDAGAIGTGFVPRSEDYGCRQRVDFAKRVGGLKYESVFPAGQKPPFEYWK